MLPLQQNFFFFFFFFFFLVGGGGGGQKVTFHFLLHRILYMNFCKIMFQILWLYLEIALCMM